MRGGATVVQFLFCRAGGATRFATMLPAFNICLASAVSYAVVVVLMIIANQDVHLGSQYQLVI